jgi:hypothetical protein
LCLQGAEQDQVQEDKKQFFHTKLVRRLPKIVGQK